MNKKVVLPVLIIISLIIVGIVGWQLYSNQNIPDRQATIIANTPIPTESPEQSDFTASFEIYTNGTKRIFTDVKYHNQSQNVFIQNSDPSTIYVKTAGTTWADFFETLPFSLSKLVNMKYFYLGRNDIRENLDLSSGWFRDILESQPPIPVVGDFIGSISDLSDPLLGIVARTTGMCGDVKEQLDIYFDPEDENATWEPGEWGIVKDILVQRYLIEPGCL